MPVSGEHVGRWPIDLPKPDWEAMVLRWRGKNYLLIADIGDNFAMRGSVSYIILEEPDIKPSPKCSFAAPRLSTLCLSRGPRGGTSSYHRRRYCPNLPPSRRTLSTACPLLNS